MKKMIFVLLVTPLFSWAQSGKVEPLTFTEVVEVPGVTKDDLFQRGREWFNESFHSSKDVFQIADRESGELAGKGNMAFTATYRYMGERTESCKANFRIGVWVKDGKYKYEFTNFEASIGREKSVELGPLSTSDECSITWPMVSQKKVNEIYVAAKQGVAEEVKKITDDLKAKMSQKSKAQDF